MSRITSVKALADYRLGIEFENGVKGEVDLSKRLFGPVFEPLKDRKLFSRVSLDEFGVICWPNGADLAPDAVYASLKGSAGVSA